MAVATAAAVLFGAVCPACRDAPPAPTVGPGLSGAAGASTGGPASAPRSAEGRTPDPQPGARLYYGAQGVIAPPEELLRLVPPAFPGKPVERNRGRGMELMRLATGRRFATLTLLTLQPADTALRTLAAHAASLGFAPDTTIPGEQALVHPEGERLTLAANEVEGQPVRVRLRLTGPEGGALPALPPLPAELTAHLGALKVIGFEETLLHGVAAGARVTDVAREALIVRAPTPASRATGLTALEVSLTQAGYKRSEKRNELWERPATQEVWLIRPTDDPSGDVLLSHQRRFRRE